MDVGLALLEIQDRRLYKDAEFERFEDYCRERWGFTDRRARQLIDAAEIGTMVPVVNERQARELAPLRDQPDVAKDVMDQLLGEKEPEEITA